jgi:preprotein translocase subunit SecG
VNCEGEAGSSPFGFCFAQTDIRMLTVIIVIHLMLVVAMIGVVLLQKSEGGGFVSGGTGGGFLTSRGTANVLSRTTALLAVGFFLTSLLLSWLASFQRHPASVITGAPAGQTAPGNPGTMPLNQGSGGVLNQLQKGIPNAPAGPNAAPAPAPSGPQAPESR